jgi:hypothetical protein
MANRRKKATELIRDAVTGVTKLPYIEPTWASKSDPMRIRGGRSGGKSRPIAPQEQIVRNPDKLLDEKKKKP